MGLLAAGIIIYEINPKYNYLIPRKLNPSNCPKDYEEHPVILISMDGFRADYLDRGYTTTLRKLSERGVSTPFMKSSYPTLTFPNHYSIVTVRRSIVFFYLFIVYKDFIESKKNTLFVLRI